MAVTKIYAKRARLDKLIRYVINPDKTDEMTLVSGIGCEVKSAYSEMMQTKELFHQTDGVQAYHIIQSFSPEEIDGETAHELGQQFAEEYLKDYQVVIATHVDKHHVHNHLVLNSVSDKTGKKYHSSPESYYKQIRTISDRLCREYGLSVIMNPARNSLSYMEWKLQQNGILTLRELFDQDVKECLSQAMDVGQFYALMEDRGYAVRHHGSYPSFVPDGYTHPFRMKSKGKSVTEDDLARMIEEGLSNPDFEVLVPKVEKAFVPYGKQHGPHRIYLSWLYALKLIGQGKRTQYLRINYKELRRFEQIKACEAFLRENGLETTEQVRSKKSELQQEMETLTKSRIIWNSKKKRQKPLFDALATMESLKAVPALYTQGVVGIEEDYRRYLAAEKALHDVNLEALREERDDVYAKIASVNAEIRSLRKGMRMIDRILADTPELERSLRDEIEVESPEQERNENEEETQYER